MRRVKLWMNPKAKDEKVFPLTYPRFRHLFLLAISTLMLPVGIWRTHSLRRGGATQLLQDTRSPEYCAVVGRWANLNSCRKYLRAGEALTARLLAMMSAECSVRIAALQLSSG